MIEKLRQALPKAPVPWLKAAIDECPKAGIDTPNELASFLAQCAHESKEFTQLEENLNYSAKRLMAVWPKRFPTLEFALKYEHNSILLANYVYANRMGNGDEASGDGWHWRARGPIQITGADNYKLLQKGTGLEVIAHPDILLTPIPGIISACWYWKTHNLDAVDDDADVRIETRRINGGETGLNDRQNLFNHILMYLESV